MKKKKLQIAGFYAAAFLLPVIFLEAAFAVNGVYPFGDRSALIIDGIQQNLGLFAEMIRKISAGSSVFYSSHAFGYDFYQLLTYYLLSPLNLLAVFLEKLMYVNEAILVIILCKCGFMGVSMYWYTSKHNKNSGLISLAAAVMYALSSFVLGYYSNIMWLDSIILLPVLAYTVERLASRGKWMAYTVVLTLIMVTNYYMAFLLCIFVVLYFIWCMCGGIWDRPKIETKNLWTKIWKCLGLNRAVKFAMGSVMAAGMSACILIPSLYSLTLTRAADELGTIFSLETYGNIWHQLAAQFFESDVVELSTDQSAVNLYCGSASLFMILLFLQDHMISARKRIMGAALILIYVLSFHFRTLNLIMHGLHKPMGLPNRFSIMLVFLVIVFGMTALNDAKFFKSENVMICSLLSLGFVVLTAYNADRESECLVTLICVTVYSVIVLLRTGMAGAILSERIYRGSISVLICIELLAHTIYGISENGTSNRDVYVVREDEINTMLDKVSDDTWHRVSIVHGALRNEEILYGLNGMSLFSSVIPEETLDLFEAVGCESYNNRFQCSGAADIVNTLFGVKYLVFEGTRDVPSPYEFVDNIGSLTLRKNNWALAHGYMVNANIVNWDMSSSNPMEVQNNMLTSMGFEKLYEMDYIEPKEISDDETVFDIMIPSRQHAYLYIPGDEADSLYVNGEEFEARDCTNNFVDLGYDTEKRSVTVSAKMEIPEALIGWYEEDAIEKIYNALSRHEMKLDEYKDGTIKGTVTADGYGMLLISNAYSNGWSATVDGEETPLQDVNGLMGILLEGGEHKVELKYQTPFFSISIVVSLAFISIFAIIIILNRARKNNEGSVIHRYDMTLRQ